MITRRDDNEEAGTLDGVLMLVSSFVATARLICDMNHPLWLSTLAVFMVSQFGLSLLWLLSPGTV